MKWKLLLKQLDEMPAKLVRICVLANCIFWLFFGLWFVLLFFLMESI